MPQALVSGVALGSVYALIAQGYYVTFTTTETLNFAQGEFLMVGALTSFSLMVLAGVPFLVAIVVVVVLMVGMGILVERVAIRPLRQLLSVGWILSTVGVSVILRQSAEIYWGREQKRVPSIFGDAPIFVAGTGIFPQEVFIIVASLLTMAGLLVFLKRSTFGKALQAVAFNPATAGLMGINVRQMVVVAYVISSILAGIAGVLIAPVIFAHAEMGALLGLKAFAAAIIGGIENPVGILVVGIGLGIAEFIVAGYNASFRDAVTFLLLILILAWRPQGLFERVTAEKV
ncbi:MAG: branched-chain amino acid ABC transporter permease [Chloroflexi bacterium]|nr:branched-chain amino acid ABC transporter permease [Chloroflexota bacterium]